MEMMDIKYLKGSTILVDKFSHLKGAQVDSRFDKILQLEDKSFVIKVDGEKKFSINIEDGRKSVHPNGAIPYCLISESPKTHNCVTWRGDPKADPFFVPGPDKDIGKTEHINWEEKTRKPAIWVWLMIGFLVWQTLS